MSFFPGGVQPGYQVLWQPRCRYRGWYASFVNKIRRSARIVFILDLAIDVGDVREIEQKMKELFDSYSSYDIPVVGNWALESIRV